MIPNQAAASQIAGQLAGQIIRPREQPDIQSNAFGIRHDVRFWPLADTDASNVAFGGKADMTIAELNVRF